MKKLLIALLVLSACQKAKVAPVRDDWAEQRKAYTFLPDRPDSAFYYFNKATTNTQDSLQVASAYNYMGIIQAQAGDHYGAQESLAAGLRFLNEQDPRHQDCLARTYNELGMNNADLKNYPTALELYGKATHFSRDSALTAIIQNNRAYAYQELGEYPKALVIYRQILDRSRVRDIEYARSLTNWETTKGLQDPGHDPVPGLMTALAIRLREKDIWGQNSSYAHLSDNYSRKRPDSALFFAQAMYRVARELDNPDERLAALGRLIRYAPAGQARSYFLQYRSLEDSIQTVRSAAKNQFALIRYEVEKHRTENLALQKDNAEKRYQILRQQAALLVGFVVLISTGLGLRYRYRKRQRQLKLENELAIKESEMRTAKKVHDGVANGIYQLMSEVENGERPDDDGLADRLEALYHRSRDISHERPLTGRSVFTDELARQLITLGKPDCLVSLVGNETVFWSRFSDPAKEELYYVLQELMVNMKKHSGARNVLIKFGSEPGYALISYSDDGRGIAPSAAPGLGLRHAENRIAALGGSITFDTLPGEGLRIRITLPST